MTSEITYLPKRAVCADGVTRTVRVKCYRFDGSMAADTYFSVPAYVQIKGKTVRGYLTGSDLDGDASPYAFHAYTYGKNGTILGTLGR